jgi:two-component system sensor histidine kinase TctE
MMLRTKLLSRLLPPVLLVILAASFFAYRLSLTLASDAYDAALFDSARSLAQQIQVVRGRAPQLTLPRVAEEILLSDPYDRIFYRVTDAHGATLAGDARVPLPADAPTGAQPVRFYDARVGDDKVRASAYGLFAGGTDLVGTVVFAETLVKRTRLSERVLATVVVPLLLVTLVVAGLVWYGVRSGLSPLDRLASTLAKRGWGDLRTVGSDGVPGEVRPLVESLDNLMIRLDASHSAQQRFISEAAHQLRTPLAGLSAQVERALRAQDVEALKPALEQLQRSSRRVTRLVNQLLVLARAEPGGDPQRELAPTELSRIVQDTCREWVPEALAAGVDFGFAGDGGPVRIVGHEVLLGEMLNNLIDNALRYGARRGQSVTVRLVREPRVEIAVEDEGPGIPEEERERVFERFHRLAGSPPGGAGLGLAIVREIARLHHADVLVEAGPGGRGATFRVIFPPRETAK